MRPFVTRLLFVAGFTATALPAVSVPGTAHASHYRLPVAGFLSEAETAALRKAGFDTTLALLDAIASLKGRQDVARRSGLPLPRLTLIAAEVDLLRVSGVGPSMVRLLQAAGVRHSRDLARSAAADLARRLEAANAAQRIAPVTPNAQILVDWIRQAAGLKAVVEGLP
jgi:predicted flap endonuclease-1-like 5' DNA nuclease